MFVRDAEAGLLDVLEKDGVGCIPFSPLAQGLLTNKYLHGIPEDSRAAKSTGFLQTSQVTDEVIGKIKSLNTLSRTTQPNTGPNGAGLVAERYRVTSVLIGASKPEQLADSLKALDNIDFSAEELSKIEDILK
jgi:L-glyceraldehyde 3-phosphate reductase